MSLRRFNPRRDANERGIVAGLRAIGAEVWLISGKGLPDALVRFRGRLHAFEIKTEKGKLTEYQGQFQIVRTLEDALKAIGAVR